MAKQYFWKDGALIMETVNYMTTEWISSKLDLWCYDPDAQSIAFQWGKWTIEGDRGVQWQHRPPTQMPKQFRLALLVSGALE